MAQKWFQSVGVRAALILTIGGIVVAGMNILHERSQVKRDVASKDARLADLTDQLSLSRSEIQRLETQLAPFKTIALEKYTGSEQEKLQKLADDLQDLKDPLKRPIGSATSHVEIWIESDESRVGVTLGGAGHLAFVKDGRVLLLMVVNDWYSHCDDKGKAVYRVDFQLAAKQSIVGKPVEELRTSDSIEIRFAQMVPNSRVLRGKVSIVLNGSIQLEFEVPPQQTEKDRLYIRDVAAGFTVAPSL